MENLNFENVLVEAAKLPIVKVDRELFLRKELRDKYSKEIVDLAIEYNPAYAGIKTSDIDRIAKSCINADTTRVTAISAAAGIPGGLAMIGTIPADLAQYFGHILHILQELIYLYGWSDLKLEGNELTEETKNILTLFIGIMFGVNGAVTAVNKIAGQAAKQIAKKLPQKALTKGVVYPIVKKIATFLGVKMTKDVFAKGVAKAVPILGAVVSGGVTLATFKPMAEKLKKFLSQSNIADPKYYEKLRTQNVIDVEASEVDGKAVMDELDEQMKEESKGAQ